MKTLLLLIVVGLPWHSALAQDGRVTIPGTGITLHPNAPVPEGFSDTITELLLPAKEWKAEGLSFAGGATRAYQVNYSRGGIITVDRDDANGHCQFSLHIQRPASAKIRHQIMVGTEFGEWDIVRRDPLSPEDKPFARTYLLSHPATGTLLGLAFYDGTWAQLACSAVLPAPRTLESSMRRLTWDVARRLRQHYEQQIASIAKSLDDGSAVPTRPDLPDADARLDKGIRKPLGHLQR